MHRRTNHRCGFSNSRKSNQALHVLALRLGLAAGLTCFAPAALPATSQQSRPPAHFLSGKPDQAEGARMLSEFQRAGIAGTYWLAFELRVMPRRGDERRIGGHLFGTRGKEGPLTRLTLAGNDSEQKHWLIQSGLHPAAWSLREGRVAPLEPRHSFDPIEGTDLTLFDLQMPYLYWTDFVYEGVARVRGRPAHSFLLYPPREDPAGPAAVRVFIDTQYEAMVQAEWVESSGDVARTVTVLDLKKIGDSWIVRSLDLRNYTTREKTRFEVTAAALNLTLPPDAFEPASLAGDDPVVPASEIRRF